MALSRIQTEFTVWKLVQIILNFPLWHWLAFFHYEQYTKLWFMSLTDWKLRTVRSQSVSIVRIDRENRIAKVSIAQKVVHKMKFTIDKWLQKKSTKRREEKVEFFDDRWIGGIGNIETIDFAHRAHLMVSNAEHISSIEWNRFDFDFETTHSLTARRRRRERRYKEVQKAKCVQFDSDGFFLFCFFVCSSKINSKIKWEMCE